MLRLLKVAPPILAADAEATADNASDDLPAVLFLMALAVARIRLGRSDGRCSERPACHAGP